MLFKKFMLAYLAVMGVCAQAQTTPQPQGTLPADPQIKAVQREALEKQLDRIQQKFRTANKKLNLKADKARRTADESKKIATQAKNASATANQNAAKALAGSTANEKMTNDLKWSFQKYKTLAFVGGPIFIVALVVMFIYFNGRMRAMENQPSRSLNTDDHITRETFPESSAETETPFANPDLDTLRQAFRTTGKPIPYILRLVPDASRNRFAQGDFNCEAIFIPDKPLEQQKPSIRFPGDTNLYRWDHAMAHAAQLASRAANSQEELQAGKLV